MCENYVIVKIINDKNVRVIEEIKRFSIYVSVYNLSLFNYYLKFHLNMALALTRVLFSCLFL